MPDEIKGFGPAAIEDPDLDEVSMEQGGTPEIVPSAPEIEPVAPEQGGKYEKLLTAVTQSPSGAGTDIDATKNDAGSIQAMEGEKEKIEQLVKLAQSKGLPHAIKVAEAMKDYYVLDMLHDELVDNLYDRLLEQGLITKE